MWLHAQFSWYSQTKRFINTLLLWKQRHAPLPIVHGKLIYKLGQLFSQMYRSNDCYMKEREKPVLWQVSKRCSPKGLSKPCNLLQLWYTLLQRVVACTPFLAFPNGSLIIYFCGMHLSSPRMHGKHQSAVLADMKVK